MSQTTTVNRDTVPIGDDIEPVGGISCRCRREKTLEPELPAVETNPKNPIRRAEQEREDCGHAVYRNWCLVCVERCCVEKHLQVEPLKEAEKERTKPSLSAFSCEDTFPILIGRDRFFCVDKFPILDRGDEGHGQTRATRYELKDSIPYLSPFLIDCGIILKDRNELS